MKKYLSAIALCFVLLSGHAQNVKTYVTHNFTGVLFGDGKWYNARVLSNENNILKVEFINTRSIYQFNNQGIVLSSTGAYPKGHKVKKIILGVYDKMVYEDLAWYTVEKGDILGVMFPDGQDYFGVVQSVNPGYFDIIFCHSQNRYGMIKDKMGPNKDYKGDNKWKVSYQPPAGMYPHGTEIIHLYRLTRKIFYSADSGDNFFQNDSK
jgi:hypothetical protein